MAEDPEQPLRIARVALEAGRAVCNGLTAYREALAEFERRF